MLTRQASARVRNEIPFTMRFFLQKFIINAELHNAEDMQNITFSVITEHVGAVKL